MPSRSRSCSSDAAEPRRARGLKRPPRTRLIRLVLEYDGSGFFGWQGKALATGGGAGRSVQDTLAAAIHSLTGERGPVTGAGRTDAGVSALGQVATFITSSTIPAERFAAALNGHLPPDVAALGSDEVPHEFHPRKSARSKHYRYVILNRAARSALHRSTSAHVSAALDVEAMKQAARNFVGKHDFTSFAAKEAAVSKNPVREVTRCDVRREGDFVVIDVEGPGFLMHQVRTMAGSLIEVGRGKNPPAWIAETMAARDRSAAGPTAPASGLTLVEVRYS